MVRTSFSEKKQKKKKKRKKKSDLPLCHLFTCDNKIPDNPAAAPLPPFTNIPLRRGVLVQPYVIKFVIDLR
jgi:hypothetical protein